MDARTKAAQRRDRWISIGVLFAMLLLPVGAVGAVRVAEIFFWPRRPHHHFCGTAVGDMRDYAEAQIMYRRLDWDKDGQLEYAPDYTVLSTQVDSSGVPIRLIESAFAAAKGYGGAPKHGCLFKEMSTIGLNPIDWKKDYALCAIPASYGTTGYRTYIVTTDGVVWYKDRGAGARFLDDFPSDPQAEGWVIVAGG